MVRPSRWAYAHLLVYTLPPTHMREAWNEGHWPARQELKYAGNTAFPLWNVADIFQSLTRREKEL